MSTPDTTPDTISDTIPGGGPDETTDTVQFQDCAPGWITYDGFTCVLDDRPPTTEAEIAVAAPAPTTTLDPGAVDKMVVIVEEVHATTTTEAVVVVRPSTLPATGAGDAMSIGVTASIVLGLGAVALIVRRKVARV